MTLFLFAFSGKITDSEECTSLYSDKDLIQTSDSDKGKQLLVNSSVEEADFNIVHLYGFSQFFLKNKGQEEIDDEVKKVIKRDLKGTGYTW